MHSLCDVSHMLNWGNGLRIRVDYLTLHNFLLNFECDNTFIIYIRLLPQAHSQQGKNIGKYKIKITDSIIHITGIDGKINKIENFTLDTIPYNIFDLLKNLSNPTHIEKDIEKDTEITNIFKGTKNEREEFISSLIYDKNGPVTLKNFIKVFFNIKKNELYCENINKEIWNKNYTISNFNNNPGTGLHYEIPNRPYTDEDLHNHMINDEAGKILTNVGLMDGRFLVRKRENPNEFVLSVVYKGKPSHHLIKKNTRGILTIGTKEYGLHTELSELIKFLSKPVKGWPVPLDKSIPKNIADVLRKYKIEDYLHEDIGRATAEELINNEGLNDETFLVRKRESQDEYDLSVVYKGKITHYLIEKDTISGILTINNKIYGNYYDLNILINYLSNPVKSWPVLLNYPVVPLYGPTT